MVKRTETIEFIVNSFRELLKNESFDHITIHDICDNCSISRMTFYRYFRDKYELMNWVYISQMRTIFNNNLDFSGWIVIIDKMLDIIIQNSQYFMKVANTKGQNSFEEFLVSYGMEYCMLSLKKEFHDDIPTALIYAVRFYCVGTTRLVLEWIKGGMKEPKEEFRDNLCACLPASLSAYIHF